MFNSIYHHKHTTESFIEHSQTVHNFKYDYSKVDYQGNKIRVIIICPTHGEFFQRPNDHLGGHGCQLCSKRSGTYNLITIQRNGLSEAAACLYVLQARSETELTSKGYIVTLLAAYSLPLIQAYQIEQTLIHTNLKYVPLFRFGGWRECLSNFDTSQISNILKGNIQIWQKPKLIRLRKNRDPSTYVSRSLHGSLNPMWGKHHTNTTKSKISIKASKRRIWVLQQPDGSIVETQTPREFCKTNNISFRTIQSSLNRKKSVRSGMSAGWLLLQSKHSKPVQQE